MDRRIVAGIAIAVVSAAAFGSGGAFVPPLLETGWSPGMLSLLRTAGATLLLAIPTLVVLRGRWGDVRRQGWRIAAYGGLAIAGTQFTYYQALGRIPVGTALMIEYLAPVILIAATAIARRHLPPVSVLLGAALALGGLALVLDLSRQGGSDIVGILYALAAAVCCALYFALSASIDLPPIGVAGLGLAAATLSTGALSAVGLIPLAWSDRLATIGGAELPPAVLIAYITVVATTAAYLTGIAAARLLGGRRASFVSLSEVLAAVIAAAILLGQLPSFIQLVGAAVLLTGIVLVLRAGDTAPRSPHADPDVDHPAREPIPALPN